MVDLPQPDDDEGRDDEPGATPGDTPGASPGATQVRPACRRSSASGARQGAGGIDFSQVDFNQVMRMLQSTGPVNWEIARQTAEWVALEGKPEPGVAAADRAQFEELAHAAQTLVVAETGLTGTFATNVQTVGPKGWVDLHLVALRPVLEALATTLGAAMQPEDDADAADLDEELASIPGLSGLGNLGALSGPRWWRS